MKLLLSLQEAAEHGLLACKHCRWPKNNHFDFEPYHCAFNQECPGYEVAARIGVLVNDDGSPCG